MNEERAADLAAHLPDEPVPEISVSPKLLRKFDEGGYCLVHNSTIFVCSCIPNFEICPLFVVKKGERKSRQSFFPHVE